MIELAKLHNFCISESEDEQESLENLAIDTEVMMSSGGYITINFEEYNIPIVEGLRGGGHHFDDIPRSICQRHDNKILFFHESYCMIMY